MKQSFDISRRQFVFGSAAGAAGLSVGMRLPFGANEAAAMHHGTPEVNAWVVIHPDDTVVVRIARSEMGQGTLTGLAQMVAEELECDWSKVTAEYPTPGENLRRNRVWGDFSTGGSRGIRASHDYVREGGAAAREMLIQAAANRWGVPAGECSAANSVITHGPSGETVTFGAVAMDASKQIPPTQVTLKDPSDWKIVGQPVKRLDTAGKLDGSQIYASDFKMPNMLTATIKACPTFGGTVASYDASAAESMGGVHKVVQIDDYAIAVVADSFWQAKKGLDAVDITWDRGEHGAVTSESIDAFLDEGLTADDAFVGNENGDVTAGISGASKVVEAVYSYPYQNHAPMETMNATAVWTADKCEVWCPTQNGEAALAAAAEAAELDPSQCEVYKFHLGGGFGRRGAFHDFVHQTVKIAKQMPGTPVKLIWTREEDMTHGHYHPVTKARLVGGLDENGDLSALHVRISGQSILAAVRPQWMRDGADPITFQGLLPDTGRGTLMGDHSFTYTIPHFLADHSMRNPHVPPGFWRGVNINQNAVYVECFLDELAQAAGADPLEFRRKLLANHPENLAVLNAVADRVGWDTPAPDGVYRGLATCKAFGSHLAACAEVSVSDSGELTMHRIVCATDPGHAVNPQQIEAQVQGSFVYGLSAMLYGACTVKDGAIEQENFDTFPSMRIAEMPDVDVIVMPSGGFWGGVGEPTIAVAAPAVLNAIAAATGIRHRTLPLDGRNLREAEA